MKKRWIIITLLIIISAVVFWIYSNFQDSNGENNKSFEYNENSINFKIIEQTDTNRLDGPHLFLQVSTEKIYQCSNFGIEGNVETKDNLIKVSLGEIIKPNICETFLGPAKFAKELDLREGEYALEFYSNSQIDRYRLQILKKEIIIEDSKSTFSKTEQSIIYRIPENLISVTCFRYPHTCENEEEIIDELCPILFSEVEKIASPAEDELIDRGVFGRCDKEGFERGTCKYYYYTQEFNKLNQTIYASENYTLKFGHKANCTGYDLYYRNIDTWLGHRIVVR